MTDLAQRIARLSPKQRQALAIKMQKAGMKVPVELESPDADHAEDSEVISKERLLPGEAPSPEEIRRKTQLFYNTISRQLNSSIYREHARFLNIGYVEDGSPRHAVRQLPERTLNRACVDLVLELVGRCQMDGLTVLDVGCGRGGSIDAMATHFRPASLTGIDLCPEAIAFCQRNYAHPNARFLIADAERIPFSKNSFDRVYNLESSHNYPNIEGFFQEVQRLLKPGGLFLHSDILPKEKMQRCVDYLRGLGMRLVVDRDITANVLLSCRATGDVHLAAFEHANDGEMMSDFLGLQGSRPYRDMEQGRDIYFIHHWEKPHGP